MEEKKEGETEWTNGKLMDPIQPGDEGSPNYFSPVGFGAGERLLVTDTLAMARLYLPTLILTYPPSLYHSLSLSLSLFLTLSPSHIHRYVVTTNTNTFPFPPKSML